jgi:hypothetical protein
MISPNDGWAAGGEVSNMHGHIYYWNGLGWNSMFYDQYYYVTGISMVSSTDGWAVMIGGSKPILRWNGLSWNAIDGPLGIASCELQDVFMVSANDGWIVGNYYANKSSVVLHWDGANWTFFPCPQGRQLKAVFMSDSDNGWAVGYKGFVIRWNGVEWTEVFSRTSHTLNDVYAIDSGNVWAVGGNDPDQSYKGRVIIHWDGVSWTPIVESGDFDLFSVSMVTPSDGWAVGSWGTILRWNGVEWANWAQAGSSIYYQKGLRCVDMVGPNDGWIGGEVLLRWNGSVWVPEIPPLIVLPIFVVFSLLLVMISKWKTHPISGLVF